VLGLEGSDGTPARLAPEVVSRVGIDREHLARIRRTLLGAVAEAHGTGGRARLPGVEVAGKTGTAQVVRLQHTEGMDEEEVPRRYRDHAWFVAFAPAENAEIVVAVLVEHAGHGGTEAAPLAQRVLARYFEKRGGPSRTSPALRVPSTSAEGMLARN
jgi:penicillin-binding protein 2